MNYSNVLPFLSGLLLFALAGYSIRLARLFSAVRTGWLVFGSLAFLALLYVVLLASPFRGTVLWSARADITYSLSSLVLLVAMARLELLFKQRLRKASAAEDSVSEWQSSIEKQYERLTEAHKELQETKVRLEAKLAEQMRLQERTRNSSSELRTPTGLTEHYFQQSTAALAAQLTEHKRKLQEEEQLHQERLATARGVVEELCQTVDGLRTEVDTLQEDNRKLQADIGNLQSESAVLQEKYDLRLEETEALQHRCEQQKEDIVRLQSQLNKQAQTREELEAIGKKLASRSVQPKTPRMVAGLTRDLGRLRTGVDSVNLAVDHLVQSGVSRLVQNSRLLGELSATNGLPTLRRGPGRKVLPECISQLVRDLSGEHRSIVRKIESLRKNVEKVQTTVASHQEPLQASENIAATEVNDRVENALLVYSPPSSGPTPVIDECRPNKGEATTDGGKRVDADLRERLLSNATETGTASGDEAPKFAEPEEADAVALLDESNSAP